MKTDSFELRHLGPRDQEVKEMLKTIGVESLDKLIYNTIPSHINLKKALTLPEPMSEYEFSIIFKILQKKINYINPISV